MRAALDIVVPGLLSLTASISAQQLDPVVNMCVRFDHQSVVKNNILYIDGGRETFTNVDGTDTSDNNAQIGNITQGYNNNLISIDLHESWDWKLNITENVIAKEPNPSTGTSVPVLVRGALYGGSEGDDNIYLFGGTTSYWNTSFPGYEGPFSQQYSLWSFDVKTQAWNQYDVTLGSTNRPSSGSYADATDQGLSFYFNGVLDSGSEIQTQEYGSKVKQFIEGMVVIDTNNRTARNLSTTAVSGDLPRSRGRMTYVPGIGPNGILVQVGGNQQSITNTTEPSIGELLPMYEIDIFDVSSYYNASTPDGTWYKQSTSGDTPPSRIDFCLILASAPDNSSHNIYMYGGRGVNNKFMDDIWVLSLPGFVWEKVYQGTAPRAGHTCHRVGSRTMITVGGTANTNYTSTKCDWEVMGVGVFEISDLTWGSVYNATHADYEVPTRVIAKIGGSPGGNATMTQPSGGFSQTALAEVFNLRAHILDSNPAMRTPTPTASPVGSDTSLPPKPKSPHTNSHTATMVGALVGSVAFVALAISVGFYYRQGIHRFVTGDESPLQEMDGQRAAKEIMDNDVCWELPADMKPVELWSATDREDKPCISEMHLKHAGEFF